jgi:hypothetical protein
MEQEYTQSQNVTLPIEMFRTIDNPLPDGKYLIHPLVIQIQYEDEEVLVNDPSSHIYTSGVTVQEAIAEFKRILVDEFNQLTHDEGQLSPRLQQQLQYLRSIIR